MQSGASPDGRGRVRLPFTCSRGGGGVGGKWREARDRPRGAPPRRASVSTGAGRRSPFSEAAAGGSLPALARPGSVPGRSPRSASRCHPFCSPFAARLTWQGPRMASFSLVSQHTPLPGAAPAVRAPASRAPASRASVSRAPTRLRTRCCWPGRRPGQRPRAQRLDGAEGSGDREGRVLSWASRLEDGATRGSGGQR